MNVIDLCERGLIPDRLTRHGMRQLMAKRLDDEGANNSELASRHRQQILDHLRSSPIAIETDAANEQHYEVPAAFFHRHLGPRLKYSCCLYPTGQETLAQAEELMLSLYAERAGLVDGMRILDLGCGWGSLSLWLAEHYPNSQIVGLSNSHGQREFIEQQAAQRGLSNLTIVTGNIVEVDFPVAHPHSGDEVLADFDRIISIEMFEHMRNYGLLLAKLARWLTAEGQLFVHIFAHRHLTYFFEDKADDDWMTRYFFTGGIMPSDSLLAYFQDDFSLTRQWWVDGCHYEKTSNHWLQGMDDSKDEVMPLLVATYGEDQAKIWFQRWRMFYMAVAELFGYNQGREWGVGHYLFQKR